jgi:hypothetical protein
MGATYYYSHYVYSRFSIWANWNSCQSIHLRVNLMRLDHNENQNRALFLKIAWDLCYVTLFYFHVNFPAPPVSGGTPPPPPPVSGGLQQLQQLAGPQGPTFIREDRTMPEYRLYSINDVHPAMVRVPANATNGVSVVVEIWCVPADGLATLMGQEPPGLSIAKARLMDNSTVLGVTAEPALLVGMKDISNFDGNWREYIAQTGLQLIDNAIQAANLTSNQVGNATQTANLTSDQIAAIQQLRSEGELLAQNGQLRGAIDSLNTAIKMLGLKDRLYLNIPLGQTAP